MASNSFGNVFRFTTFGESHGPAIGVIIDGCPPGIHLDVTDIQPALDRRAPGKSHTSPRQERDQVQLLSGTFEGKTTGAPIALLILNQDAQSKAYQDMQTILRPGHANFTYLQKYGIFDHRGGGRASARETACRVAAGAVAEKILSEFGIFVCAHLGQLGPIALRRAQDLDVSVNSSEAGLKGSSTPETPSQAQLTVCATQTTLSEDKFRHHATQTDFLQYRDRIYTSPLFCPDPTTEILMIEALEAAKHTGNSWGGIVNFETFGVPAGLGDPVYEKLEARLAYAMMSIPASKGFEIGEGFSAATMQGDSHNDLFTSTPNGIQLESNHAGGTLGGISTGAPVYGRVAFKPTSSIRQAQMSADIHGQPALFQQPETARHDPCVAIRAVPVVQAMCAVTLVDAFLMQRLIRGV